MIKHTPDLVIREWTRETRKLIKNKTGVYAIWLKNRSSRFKCCIYVGASIHLANRLNAILNGDDPNHLLCIILKHYKEKFSILEIEFYFCLPHQLVFKEQELIKKLNSKLNYKDRWYCYWKLSK